MIEAIYYLGIAAVVVINIAALTLIVVRLVPFPAIARVTGLLAVCLVLFTLEHFVGLGELYPLSVPLTALSLGVIWLERGQFGDGAYRSSEIVFLCALLYAAVWKVTFPEIVEDNDRLADLHLVANYLNDDRLPPADAWLPYQKLDYYYAFQHYAAALLGRVFGLRPGVSFNFAAILMVALVLTLAWAFLSSLRLRLAPKLLAIGALAIGGTGISPLLHFITAENSAPFFSCVSAVEVLVYN